MPGAYSHLACRQAFPELDALPCHSFEDAFAAVREGQARYAMIAVDNSIAGRVADVHHLLPRGGLHIVGEQFVRVNHQLLGVPGATLETINQVESHVHAIGQCREFLRRHGYRAKVVADTAGRGRRHRCRRRPDPRCDRLAARGRDLRPRDPESPTSRTRSTTPPASWCWRASRATPTPRTARSITTFTFRVRNRPAALYKALGGFATNGVNMVKLESYVDGAFTQAEFYADIVGHPQHDNVRLAFEELRFFSHHVDVLGVYPRRPVPRAHRLSARWPASTS